MKRNRSLLILSLIAAAGCYRPPTPTHLVCWPSHPTAVQTQSGTAYLSLFELDSLTAPNWSDDKQVTGTMPSGQEYRIFRADATCIAIEGYQPQPAPAPTAKVMPQPAPQSN